MTAAPTAIAVTNPSPDTEATPEFDDRPSYCGARVDLAPVERRRQRRAALADRSWINELSGVTVMMTRQVRINGRR